MKVSAGVIHCRNAGLALGGHMMPSIPACRLNLGPVATSIIHPRPCRFNLELGPVTTTLIHPRPRATKQPCPPAVKV